MARTDARAPANPAPALKATSKLGENVHDVKKKVNRDKIEKKPSVE